MQTNFFQTKIIIDDFDSFEFNNQITQGMIADSIYKKVKPLEDNINAIDNVKIGNRSKAFANGRIGNETYYYYDAISPHASKGIAITALCKLLKVDIADTIGIGDDKNDMDMFNVVGLSVAVDNATEQIKKQVKLVIKSNNQNGVAEFLDSL